ncbi:hypothetical protein FRC02_010603 [Tulasnella sp. 418]|nr:hypothetical protein FRC02_010603 [Tulasnella sp. 418]
MWTKQANRIDYESAEWKNFAKRVRDDKIMKENLQDYKASRKEVELYVPFISLLTRITDLFHEDQAFKKRRKPLFYALRNTVTRCGSHYDESEDVTPSRRKPDGVGILDIGTAGENTSSPDSWRNVLLCMEFKMPTATGSPIGGLARDAAPSVSSVSSSERRQTVAPIGKSLTSANSSMDHENSSVEGKLANWDDTQVKIPSSSEVSYHSAVPQGNTQASAHSEGAMAEKDESKPELSQWRVQLSSYALEIFHALGNRIHTFGILAVKSQLTFAYFDRSGAIFSTFNLEEMFEELIKFIVAFSACDSQGLGFNAHLQPPQGAPCESKAALSQKDLSGYTMTVGNKQITLKSLRDHRYGLVSRGTMVYFGHIEGVDDVVAIKLSWQPCNRTAEWGFIEHAKANGCPDDYLVKVHACAKFEDLALSKGFRSHFLEKGIELNYENREPRVLVSERLFYIGDLPSEALAHALWYMIRGT